MSIFEVNFHFSAIPFHEKHSLHTYFERTILISSNSHAQKIRSMEAGNQNIATKYKTVTALLSMGMPEEIL
ncbi:MAG: hypothetical protein IPK08_18140 [Bacteroidetes bacterium]|nr:hypothetical protein [Bacteroidota bacterium]